jgi:hypothetical protein
MRGRLDIARETYSIEREAGQGRVFAGLAALKAATSKERDGHTSDDIRERLSRVVGRSRDQDDAPKLEGRNYARERLEPDNDREQGRDDEENENAWDRDRGEGHSL